MLKQAVFLVGGLGTRLKHLTQNTPKPLIDVCGRPFLDILIEEAARHRFTDIVLLAGHLSDQVMARYDGRTIRGATIRVLVEPEPLGTGGALKFAARQLAQNFLLANGDTFFDINLRALATEVPDGGGVMALRANVAGARFGRVKLADGRVQSFHAPGELDRGPINGGIYALSRNIISRIPDGAVSLEGTIFPDLAHEGLLHGIPFDGYFIDIGVGEDLERARTELPVRLSRPALFLDRDGVLNIEKGYLHKQEEFEWVAGAREAVRLANDKGWLVFVVTNQAGVAHGFYKESDIHALHAFMDEDLAAAGAHMDAYEYCPHHPEARESAYRKLCDRRKPGPGLIQDLMSNWPANPLRSFLVGDMPHDVMAAQSAGIRGFRFTGGNLLNFIKPLLG